MRRPQLQVAIDVGSTARALQLLEEINPFVDIVEIGTPLIIEEGLAALETLKSKFPDNAYQADLKIMDAGYIEASSAFKRGADIVTVLALADDLTIAGVLKAANEHSGTVMVDMINVVDIEKRAVQLEAMGASLLCLHTAFDKQGSTSQPNSLTELQRLRTMSNCRLGIAGGLDVHRVKQVVEYGADIVVVGGAITQHAEPRRAAKRIMDFLMEQGQ